MANDPVNITKEKERAYKKLRTARGQIDGILKMIEDERYCIDISTQILSVIGLLKKSNTDILEGHLRKCVRDSILEDDQAGDDKITEIVNVLDKYIK